MVHFGLSMKYMANIQKYTQLYRYTIGFFCDMQMNQFCPFFPLSQLISTEITHNIKHMTRK